MKSEKKISASKWNAQMRYAAERLVTAGKMPSFAVLADAIVQSPAAQKLLALRLTERVGQQKN